MSTIANITIHLRSEGTTISAHHMDNWSWVDIKSNRGDIAIHVRGLDHKEKARDLARSLRDAGKGV